MESPSPGFGLGLDLILGPAMSLWRILERRRLELWTFL